MATHANRVQMTVSGTPGTGTITLGSASSGYRTFASAYGADATVDVLIVDGTAWEVARGCTYTNSGTTLSRGTLESSSTGSAISLTSAAIVSVIATADSGRRWDAAALEHSTVTGTSGAISAAVNTLYVADMSGWTADRTLTLPATAAVGDRVGVMVSVGDDAYEWIITAASGDTLNGVAGGTEWSRVFITGEVVVMRCVVANSTWVVEQDGRIPCRCEMYLSADEGSKSAATFNKVGLDSSLVNVGDIASTSSERVNIRRAGYYQVGCISSVSLNINGAQIGTIYVDAAEYRRVARASTISSTSAGIASGAIGMQLAVDKYIELYLWHDAGTQTHNGGDVADSNRLSVAEAI